MSDRYVLCAVSGTDSMMLAMVYQRVVVCVVPTVFSFCQPGIRLVNVILPKFGSLFVGMSVRPSSVGYVKNDMM